MAMRRDRFIKLLQLSRSPNDHEAVAAIRQVHRILDKAKLTWEDVIVKQPRPRRPEPPRRDPPPSRGFRPFDPFGDFFRDSQTYTDPGPPPREDPPRRPYEPNKDEDPRRPRPGRGGLGGIEFDTILTDEMIEQIREVFGAGIFGKGRGR